MLYTFAHYLIVICGVNFHNCSLETTCSRSTADRSDNIVNENQGSQMGLKYANWTSKADLRLSGAPGPTRTGGLRIRSRNYKPSIITFKCLFHAHLQTRNLQSWSVFEYAVFPQKSAYRRRRVFKDIFKDKMLL